MTTKHEDTQRYLPPSTSRVLAYITHAMSLVPTNQVRVVGTNLIVVARKWMEKK
jgi:hypothetical protein